MYDGLGASTRPQAGQSPRQPMNGEFERLTRSSNSLTPASISPFLMYYVQLSFTHDHDHPKSRGLPLTDPD
jgi:hypothetical protein